MTHDRYGRTTHPTNGALSCRVSSTGAPQSHDDLNNADRIKIRNYRQLYADRSDTVVFLSVVVNTFGRVYDDFVRLFFFYAHRETSPENYPRNLSSFVSSELHAWRILMDL